MSIFKDVKKTDGSNCIAKYGWQKNIGDKCFMFGYINSYKEAADELVDMNAPDLYLLPIFFCYRQYLELLLKNICKNKMQKDNYIKLVNKASHNFKKTWNYVKKENFIDLDDKKIDYIEDVILFFDKMDPNSFTFRYLEDKKMNRTIKNDFKINLNILKKYIDKLDDYLRYTYDNFI